MIRISKANALRVPALGAAFFIALGLLTPPSQAAPADTTPTGSAVVPLDAASAATTPRGIPFPKSPDSRNYDPYRSPAQDSGAQSAPQSAPQAAPAPEAGVAAKSAASPWDPCPPDLSAVISATGSALVQELKGLPRPDCAWKLFDLNATTSAAAFNESKMVTVANALRDTAVNYPGDNSTAVGQLVAYLRAGYYKQEQYPAAVSAYGPAVDQAAVGALDVFFAEAHSKDVTAANGEILAEVLKVVGQSNSAGRYLPRVKWLLDNYKGTWPKPMANSVDQLDWVVKDAFEDKNDATGWKAAVKADPGTLDTWYGFITRNERQLNRWDPVSNVGRHLGYFLGLPEFKDRTKPILKNLIHRYPNTGPTAALTMGLGWATREFDKGNCATYDICDLATRLMPVILPTQHVCSPNLKIRAQDMSPAQLDATCENLANQDAYFHKIIGDKGAVPGDVNTNLEVVAFENSDEYGWYAWAFYDIDVDNGGMYEEGNPAVPGNQARFIAHEASWMQPDFDIWNLNHEYTHYLDGRYNMAGDFDASQLTPTIWWVEGIAENISFGYRGERNENAITAARDKTYKLSQLFDTVYDHTANADINSARVYRWGWLAVRYMLQEHRADIDAVLAKYRAGDWNGARTFLKQTIGTRYDAGFDAWLDACASNDCGPLPDAPTGPVTPTVPVCTIADPRQFDNNCRRDNLTAATGNLSYHFINLPAGVQKLTITSSGGTGNADLYYGTNWATTTNYSAKSTNTGNGETLTITNPPAGWVYFSLAAQQDFAGVTVTTQYQ
ncbi:collagenase [Kitasatospora sp. NPDC008115]|uniref:M9 family metallopeptidase n=1 Tax=Kitasatospora sp. NPDC008115 TaxID=3364022 RepID=UPI0036DFF960